MRSSYLRARTRASLHMDSTPGNSGNLRIYDLLSSATRISRITSRHADVSTFSIHGSNGPCLIAVKHVLVNGVPAKKSIKREFEMLTDLQHILGGSISETIPRPLLLLENEGTIVFTFIPGVPLDKLLRMHANVLTGNLNPIGLRRLGRAASHVGQWLKSFHTATAIEVQKFDHSLFTAELDGAIAKCEPLRVSNLGIEVLRDRALKLSERAAGSSVPIAATHGDFLPQNILLEHGRPGVIDFASSYRSGPVYTDLAHFVGYLISLGSKPLYARKAIERAIRAFLEGYSRHLNHTVLRLYVVRAILRIANDSSQTRRRELAETTIRLINSILDEESTDPIP